MVANPMAQGRVTLTDMTVVHLPMIPPSADFMKQGACRGSKVNFFPPNGHNLLTRPALELCNSCPVQMACLDYALANNIDHGIWGGTSERARRRIRKARRNVA